MTQSETGSASITIDSSPGAVYAVVSDVTRMGEFSPECVRCEWIDGATGPAVGARFHGWNNAGGFEWDVNCEVTEAVPGEVFAFKAAVELGDNATEWKYTIEAAGDGTRLTESFVAPLVNAEGSASNIPGRSDMLVKGCETTIAAIKDVVEAG